MFKTNACLSKQYLKHTLLSDILEKTSLWEYWEYACQNWNLKQTPIF